MSMKRLPYLEEVVTGILCAIAVAFVLVACQPQTVIVEYVDKELVTVEPTRAAGFVNRSRFVLTDEEVGPRIGSYETRIVGVYDLEEQVYSVVAWRSQGHVGYMTTLSFRPMTGEEVSRYGP